VSDSYTVYSMNRRTHQVTGIIGASPYVAGAQKLRMAAENGDTSITAVIAQGGPSTERFAGKPSGYDVFAVDPRTAFISKRLTSTQRLTDARSEASSFEETHRQASTAIFPHR